MEIRLILLSNDNKYIVAIEYGSVMVNPGNGRVVLILLVTIRNQISIFIYVVGYCCVNLFRSACIRHDVQVTAVILFKWYKLSKTKKCSSDCMHTITVVNDISPINCTRFSSLYGSQLKNCKQANMPRAAAEDSSRWTPNVSGIKQRPNWH